jgi:uncharacterized membrane protein required for colicin V production
MGLAVDLLVVLLLCGSVIRGWQAGLLFQIAHLAVLIVCFFVARGLAPGLEKMVASSLGVPPLAAAALAFFGTFGVLAFIGGFLVRRMTRDLLPEASTLSQLNRMLGAAAGVAKGGLIAFLALVLLLQLTALDKRDHPLGSSRAATWVSQNQDFIVTGRVGTLAKLAWVVGTREPIELARDEGFQRLLRHPKGAVLTSPAVLEALSNKDFVTLMKNEALWALLDEAEVRRVVAAWPWNAPARLEE